MVVIDWKMKFEPVSYRGLTSEHYGKRGISWHGVFAYFYRYTSDESTGEEYVERVVVKADQIMNGKSNQDGKAVLSMVEAFLYTAEETFPFLESAVICSNNAGCYHKKEFVFGCAVLNLVNSRSIRINRLIHSETQDGKCLIDAHFARGTRQVVMYIKTTSSAENKQVHSPKELAEALNCNGGIQNSYVHYIGFDRARLSQFATVIDKASDQAMEFFSRASDIEFVDKRFRVAGLCALNPAAWKEINLK
jgi:regulator of extracellular matrix RemA (YlzA/DUF370 family)